EMAGLDGAADARPAAIVAPRRKDLGNVARIVCIDDLLGVLRDVARVEVVRELQDRRDCRAEFLFLRWRLGQRTERQAKAEHEDACQTSWNAHDSLRFRLRCVNLPNMTSDDTKTSNAAQLFVTDGRYTPCPESEEQLSQAEQALPAPDRFWYDQSGCEVIHATARCAAGVCIGHGSGGPGRAACRCTRRCVAARCSFASGHDSLACRRHRRLSRVSSA